MTIEAVSPPAHGFMAYGAGKTRTAVFPQPVEAAVQFFVDNPGRHRCIVRELIVASSGNWASAHYARGRGTSTRIWRNVTPKTLARTFESIPPEPGENSP